MAERWGDFSGLIWDLLDLGSIHRFGTGLFHVFIFWGQEARWGMSSGSGMEDSRGDEKKISDASPGPGLELAPYPFLPTLL